MADKNLTLGTLFTGDATNLKAALGQIKQAVKGVNTVLNTNTKASTGATTATRKATTATKKATEQYHGFTKQISRVHGGLERVKAAFKVTASYGIAASAIYMVINAFKVGTQAIIDYDQALKNLQAITGATDAEVMAMGETIKNVARTTKFSTSEVSEGMVLLGQAGFDAGEAMDAMQATANLATGTLSDMKLTTDLLTTTIRAFSLDTMEAGRVSDVMANAINKSKLTIDKLRISFNYIGATAAQAGVSLEETAATMMTLANNGLRASTIGTGMRQVLSRLIAPNSRLREAYEAQGVALDQVNPRTVGYQKVLENLTAILFNSETNAVNMAKAFELFGLRGAQAAAILVKGYVGGEFQTALNNVYEVGTAAEMSGTQQEGLGVKFKNLADRAKLVAVALGEGGVGGALAVLTDILIGVTIAFEAFATSAVGGVIVKVTLLVATFTALRMATSLLVSSFKGLIILKMITSNFLLLTTGLGAATAGFTVMTGVLGKLRAAFTVLWALIASHPITAIATAVAALFIALDQITGSNEKLANELAVASVEARRMAEGINLYSDSLNALDAGSREYQSVLERFQVTYPEVTKEILRMTKALDLADLATEALTEAMDKIAAKRAWEALDNATKASERYRVELGRSEVQFVRISELWPIIYHNLLGIGDAYDRTTKLQKELTEAQESQIHSLKTLVKTGEITIDQALERIEAMGLEKDAIEDLQNAFVHHFNRIGLASREAVSQIKDVFAELPLHFEQVYNQLAAKDRALFIEMIASMQRRVSAYRKNAADMGVIENELQDQIEAIQQAAFDKFVANQDKEVEVARKAAEKRAEAEAKAAQKAAEARLKERTKLLDSIKSLEEKLQEDLKIIRQAEMTESQRYNDEMLDAKQKLNDAFKAVDEARTAAEFKTAMKKIEIAREAYSQILTMAMQAAKKEVEIEKAKDEELKQVAIVRVGRFASETTRELALAQLRLNTMLRLKKIEDEYNAKWHKKRVKDAQDADKATTDSSKAAYDSMKTAAENAFKMIGDLITNLRDKFADPAKLDIDITDPEKDLKDIKDKDRDLKEQVEKEKKLKIDTKEALLELGYTETQIKTFSNNLKKALADGSIKLDINTIDAMAAMETAEGEIKKFGVEAAKEHILNINADSAEETVVAVDKIVEDFFSGVSPDPKPEIGLSGEDAKTEIETIDTGLTEIQEKAATETVIDIVVDAALANIKLVLDALAKIVDTTSTHTIIVRGLAALKAAIRYQLSVNGLNTRSTHTVTTKFEGEGSTTKPLGEKVKEVNEWLDSTTKKAEEGATYTVDFKGSGSTTTGLMDKIQQLIDIVSKFIDKLSGMGLAFDSVEEKARKVFRTIRKISSTGLVTWDDYNEYGRLINSTKSFQSGGPIPGYGGGDTVPSMLERGEFVVKKEAVAKYGAGFFGKLNAMMPQPSSQLATAGGNTFHVTFAPMVMTGDRTAMRSAAMEFKKAIGELDHQWGTA